MKSNHEMNDNHAPLWGRADIARFLGVTPAYVDMIRHRLPPPVYVGRLPRWVPEEVQSVVLGWRKQ